MAVLFRLMMSGLAERYLCPRCCSQSENNELRKIDNISGKAHENNGKQDHVEKGIITSAI